MPLLSNPAMAKILPFNAAVEISCCLEGMRASSRHLPSHAAAACAVVITKASIQLDRLVIESSLNQRHRNVAKTGPRVLTFYFPDAIKPCSIMARLRIAAAAG